MGTGINGRGPFYGTIAALDIKQLRKTTKTSVTTADYLDRNWNTITLRYAARVSVTTRSLDTVTALDVLTAMLRR